MDLIFGFFNFVGTMFASGVTLVLAFCAGAWIGAFLSALISYARTGRENGVPGFFIGVAVFLGWAIYCLATAAVGTAFLAVVGLIIVALVILFFVFIICAT